MLIRDIEIPMLLLPGNAHEVKLAKYTHNSKDEAVTPEQLYKRLMKLLQAGVAMFVYIKKDGSYRGAVGTVDPTRIPKVYTLPLKEANPDSPIQNYWDFGTNEFKAFSKDSVVSIIYIP